MATHADEFHFSNNLEQQAYEKRWHLTQTIHSHGLQSVSKQSTGVVREDIIMEMAGGKQAGRQSTGCTISCAIQ
jgi:hypothetical protein